MKIRLLDEIKGQVAANAIGEVMSMKQTPTGGVVHFVCIFYGYPGVHQVQPFSLENLL